MPCLCLLCNSSRHAPTRQYPVISQRFGLDRNNPRAELVNPKFRHGGQLACVSEALHGELNNVSEHQHARAVISKQNCPAANFAPGSCVFTFLKLAERSLPESPLDLASHRIRRLGLPASCESRWHPNSREMHEDIIA